MSRPVMDVKNVQKIKVLKEEFLSLSRKEREQISVSFLKVKLGVNSPDELKLVKNFLGGFVMELTSENLDHMINYLHSKAHTMPEFIALEDSITEIQKMTKTSDLPDYNALDAETIKDNIKPFKS